MDKNSQKGLNAKAAINHIKIESQPSRFYTGSTEILPYGIDNRYAERINAAISKSPTAKGCIKRQSEFIFGQGIAEYGGLVVNRNGETLNDVLWQAVKYGYVSLGGFCLHLNFNAFGQVAEIFDVSPEYNRKNIQLTKCEYGVWDAIGNNFVQNLHETVDLYGVVNPVEAIAEHGLYDYKGQCYYYTVDNEIYGTSPLDAAILAASFEYEAQVYPYANIKNGFSGNTILKFPTRLNGAGAKDETDGVTAQIEEVHGAEHAGSTIVISVPMSGNGEFKDFNMVEHLSPTNVDQLFVNQNEKAERDILKCYNMPEILLGVSSQGMFNQASFNDAFNYKNSDAEFDRLRVQEAFQKILSKSRWMIDKIDLVPLEMKGGTV